MYAYDQVQAATASIFKYTFSGAWGMPVWDEDVTVVTFSMFGHLFGLNHKTLTDLSHLEHNKTIYTM